MSLSQEEIDAVDDVRVEKEMVPEWGGHVYIRSIDSLARDTYEASLNDGETKNLVNFRARLVVQALSDKSGKLVYPDAASGAHRLAKRSSLVMDRLWNAIRKHNGMDEEDRKEMVKNSKSDQADSSPSS